MATAHFHAVSSANQFGGEPTDYIDIHVWFDEAKTSMPDNRHRALRHHMQGVVDAERLFGDETRCITISNGRKVPVRWVGEQHVKEDLGYVPSVQDYFKHMAIQPWMVKGARRISEDITDRVR